MKKYISSGVPFLAFLWLSCSIFGLEKSIPECHEPESRIESGETERYSACFKRFIENHSKYASDIGIIEMRDWLESFARSSQEKLHSLQNRKIGEFLLRRLLDFKESFRESSANDEIRRRRNEIEQLGNYRIGESGKTIREFAAESVRNYLPALRETDFADDPIRVLSFYLTLDGRGFIKEVRCIRGPLGNRMTILEAFEKYSQADPEKAKQMLEIMDNIRKLADPSLENEKIPAIIDSIIRTILIFDDSRSSDTAE